MDFMKENKCYLGSIGYELGQQKNISELPFFDHEKNLLDIFKARGLSSYTESQLRPHELAKSAIEKTLAKNFCLPELIDCIVLATDSFWDEAIYSRSQFNIIMNDLGLKNAYPIGVFMLECTSSSVALQIASNLVFCKKANNVLVVCTNKVKPGQDQERIIQPGISILSDAAVACLVSSQNTGEYQLLSAEQMHSSSLEELDPEDSFEDFVKGSIEGFEAVTRKLFSRIHQTSEKFSWLITNNYLKHIIMMFASKIGFNAGQCYFDNIERFAHAHTADTLINLIDLSIHRTVISGERLLLLSNSPTSWGAVALMKI